MIAVERHLRAVEDTASDNREILSGLEGEVLVRLLENHLPDGHDHVEFRECICNPEIQEHVRVNKVIYAPISDGSHCHKCGCRTPGSLGHGPPCPGCP